MEREELMKQDEMNKTWLKDVSKTVSEGKIKLPADGWDRISSALSSADTLSATSRYTAIRKGMSTRYRWIYSSTAALMALILAVTLWMKTPTIDEEIAKKIEPIATSVDILQAQSTIEDNDVEKKVNINERNITLYSEIATSNCVTPTELGIKDTALVVKEPSSVSEKDLLADKSFDEKKDSTETAETSLENKEEQLLLFAMSGSATNYESKNKISLSFHSSMNRLNNDVFNNSNVIAQPGSDSDVFTDIGATTTISKEPQHNVFRLRNNKEWSFGVSLRLMQNTRFAYESGIVFTQLTSDAICNNDGITNSSEKQTLNYLGVPLRISYSIYNSTRWQLYVSTGFMAERCVNAKIGDHSFSINNWQWSVNGAFGCQYNFTRSIGIYIEPGVNYYFDDHSGVRSIRNESPFNLNVNMGIRLSGYVN